MSADLLAEFDSFYQTPTSLSKQTIEKHQEPQRNCSAIPENNGNIDKKFRQASGDFAAWNSPDLSQNNFSHGPNQWGSIHHVAQTRPEEVEDDWGDFETGQDTKQQEKLSGDTNYHGHTVSSLASDKNAIPKVQDNSMYSLYPLAVATTQKQPQVHKSIAHAKPQRGPRDENVLFDAEEDQEEDEFGDFESSDEKPSDSAYNKPSSMEQSKNPINLTMHFDSMMGEPSSTSKPATSSVLLPQLTPSFSSFENWTQNTGQPENQPPNLSPLPSRSSDTRTGIEDSAWDQLQQPIQNSGMSGAHIQHDRSHAAFPQPRPEDMTNTAADDAWDQFDSNVPGDYDHILTPNAQLDDFTRPSKQPNLPPMVATPSSSSSSATAPPHNIPPPAMLIPLFATIFALAQTHLFEPLIDQRISSVTRDAILAHPETQTFLASYLAIVGVLARIIAGRKLRWKRDTLLAQNMRIGPASASGKSGGMKLAGIDKAESAKEEREVTEILRLWRNQLGRLRSAVTGAGSGGVPDLGGNIPIRIAKESEGGLTAPRACALCALKRNERIVKIDMEVQDSFGEWWVEHWGHRACKSFWDAQKENLSAR